MKFQLFGSKTSIDTDIMVFVNELKSIDENHQYIKKLNNYFSKLYKYPNINLGILYNGRIIETFKGTYDECNNSLYYTYENFNQIHGNFISSLYDRTEDEFKHIKLKRCLRFLISFHSRDNNLRLLIKSALKGLVNERLEVLKMIDYNIHTFPKKKENIVDIYKTISFQLAQTLALFEGIEIYSKENAIQYYPELSKFIMREIGDKNVLNHYLNELIILTEKEIPKMLTLYE